MSLVAMFPTPHLILGGARSGKSAYAESLISSFPPPYTYIATAQVLDAEMQARVQTHQARRQSQWETVEEPFALLDALAAIRRRPRPVLVDCLTLWLSNLLLNPAATHAEQAVEDLSALLETLHFPLVIVSNDVGMGIVPDNALARRFRDLAGHANQKLAQAARSVTMVIAGLPLRLK